jgi:hypothetical protein
MDDFRDILCHRHSLTEGMHAFSSVWLSTPYRGQGLPGACPVPCFSTWSSRRDASLPSFGSQRAWFPALTGNMKALRLPTGASAVAYFVRFRRPRDPSCLCVRLALVDIALLEEVKAPSRPGRWVPVARSAGSIHVDVNGISQVSRRSIPCLCSAPRPRSNRCALALAVTSMRPPLFPQRRLRTMNISGLTHAASAPALLRFAFCVATHAQGWLPAGWLAFTGRVSNPLDHDERFQIIRSSSSPVLLTLGKPFF